MPFRQLATVQTTTLVNELKPSLHPQLFLTCFDASSESDSVVSVSNSSSLSSDLIDDDDATDFMSTSIALLNRLLLLLLSSSDLLFVFASIREPAGDDVFDDDGVPLLRLPLFVVVNDDVVPPPAAAPAEEAVDDERELDGVVPSTTSSKPNRLPLLSLCFSDTAIRNRIVPRTTSYLTQAKKQQQTKERSLLLLG